MSVLASRWLVADGNKSSFVRQELDQCAVDEGDRSGEPFGSHWRVGQNNCAVAAALISQTPDSGSVS